MDGRSRDARQSADYSARTVAEAVAKAAEDLGVSVDQLNYRVIKDSSHSILGLVRTGEAVIRVFMPAAGPRAEAVAPVAAPPSAQELVERPAPEPELEEVVEAEEEYEEEPEGLLEEEEEEEPGEPQ